MRIRSTVIATTSALVMTLAVTNPAHAAIGEFEYRGSLGLKRFLYDPPNDDCINLPNTTDIVPGHSPWNKTDSTATIFTDYNCEGDNYIVMNPGKKLGLLTSVRSVVFN